jgi:hypothetical protein
VDVALIWALPVLPFQDLPQHLANVRVLADFTRPDLPFRAIYELPSRPQPYFTVYYLLAALARATSVGTAARLVCSLGALGTVFSFRALVRAAQPACDPASGAWAALLGTLLVFNPCLCMGFLSYALAIPIFAWASAAALRALRQGRPWWARSAVTLALLGAALVSVHPVAAGALALLLVLLALCRGRSGWAVAGVGLAAMAVAELAWALVGDTGTGSLSSIDWDEADRTSLGVDVLGKAFDVQWGDPLQKTNYVLWHLLGPYRAGGQLVSLLALAAATAAVLPRGRLEATAPRWVRRAVALFALACALAPWGLHAPSEITFLDFRLFTLAAVLGLACVPVSLFDARKARVAAALLALFTPAHFAWHAFAFGREARPALSLLGQLPPGGRLLSLAFHNTSRSFARQFRLSHNLPMYYTVWRGGLVSQFWARYTDHLPIGYQAGRQPAAPAEWTPGKLTAEQLGGFDHALVQATTAEDSDGAREGFRRAAALLARRAEKLGCQGLWCLYRLPPSVTPSRPGLSEGLLDGLRGRSP